MILLNTAFWAAALAYVLCFPVRSLLVHFGIVDRPNARSNHLIPTARGGGVAILLAAGGVCLATGVLKEQSFLWIGASAGGIALISFIDDIKSLPGSWRLACHAAAAIVAWFVLFGPSTGVGGTLVAGGVWAAFFVFWTVGYTNAFNFMDGINGLAGTQAVVTALGCVLLSSATLDTPPDIPLVFAAALGGSALGFLPHNAGRARLFMGDVGSAPIGYLLAVLAFWISRDTGNSLLPALFLLQTNFVFDTVITLVRRTWRGERFGAPHRDHYYQRLVRAGWSHGKVTLLETGLQVIAIGFLFWYMRAGFLGKTTVVVLIIGQWLAFFLWVDAQFLKFARKQTAPST